MSTYIKKKKKIRKRNEETKSNESQESTISKIKRSYPDIFPPRWRGIKFVFPPSFPLYPMLSGIYWFVLNVQIPFLLISHSAHSAEALSISRRDRDAERCQLDVLEEHRRPGWRFVHRDILLPPVEVSVVNAYNTFRIPYRLFNFFH